MIDHDIVNMHFIIMSLSLIKMVGIFFKSALFAFPVAVLSFIPGYRIPVGSIFPL